MPVGAKIRVVNSVLMKTARFGYNLRTGSDLRFYLLIRVHNLIKSRFGFVPENTQELHKINILLQTFPRSQS